LLQLLVLLAYHGLETFTKDHVNVFQFLTSSDWDPGEGKSHVGAAAMIVTSFSVTLISSFSSNTICHCSSLIYD
jgi:phosphate transport system permease protein